jgi:hypothetical protein
MKISNALLIGWLIWGILLGALMFYVGPTTEDRSWYDWSFATVLLEFVIAFSNYLIASVITGIFFWNEYTPVFRHITNMILRISPTPNSERSDKFLFATFAAQHIAINAFLLYSVIKTIIQA